MYVCMYVCICIKSLSPVRHVHVGPVFSFLRRESGYQFEGDVSLNDGAKLVFHVSKFDCLSVFVPYLWICSN